MIQSLSPHSLNATVSGAVREAGGSMGKEAFLQLLVTQMRNQNPLDPQKPDEMIAQLAQFSSVEQLIALNDGIASLAAAQSEAAYAANAGIAAGLIGRSVLAEGSSVSVGPAGASKMTAEVGSAGGTGTLRIFDASGKEVATRDLGTLAPGRQTLAFDPEGLPAGEYTFKLQVTDGAGAAVPVVTYMSATVDAVQFGPNGPMLVCGSRRIPLAKVAEVAPSA